MRTAELVGTAIGLILILAAFLGLVGIISPEVTAVAFLVGGLGLLSVGAKG